MFTLRVPLEAKFSAPRSTTEMLEQYTAILSDANIDQVAVDCNGTALVVRDHAGVFLTITGHVIHGSDESWKVAAACTLSASRQTVGVTERHRFAAIVAALNMFGIPYVDKPPKPAGVQAVMPDPTPVPVLALSQSGAACKVVLVTAPRAQPLQCTTFEVAAVAKQHAQALQCSTFEVTAVAAAAPAAAPAPAQHKVNLKEVVAGVVQYMEQHDVEACVNKKNPRTLHVSRLCHKAQKSSCIVSATESIVERVAYSKAVYFREYYGSEPSSADILDMMWCVCCFGDKRKRQRSS
jgi:hypothetical protein